MRFKKIKYDTKEVTLLYTTEAAGETHEHTLTSEAPPHPDFVEALGVLVHDVLDICGLPLAYEEGLRVQSVTFSHSEKTGTVGAVITALKSLAMSTAPLVLNTPHLVEEGETGAMSQLMARNLEHLRYEARQYMNGKRAQGDLFDGAPVKDGEGEVIGSATMSIRGGAPEPFDAHKLASSIRESFR